MAPRMQRDYHSTGDVGRYSLRTLRHGENNFLQSHNVDVSRINGKEDFFRCIGLQMRRSRYEYKMSNSGCKVKKINIPNGVALRDCSVVILETPCELCGKCFKCETDLNMHNALEHQIHEKIHTTTVKGTQCTESDIEVLKQISKPFGYATVESGKNFVTKLHKRLRVTFKIGEEIITKTSVKRKHLKRHKVDTYTQTELYFGAELVTDKDVYETVSRIDPLMMGNSPCEYYNSPVFPVHNQNQYFVSNIVAGKQTDCEESVTQEENHLSCRLNKLTMPTNDECGTDCHIISEMIDLESNFNLETENCNLYDNICNLQNNSTNSNSNKSSADLNSTLIRNNICCKSQVTKTSKSIFVCDKKNDSAKFLTNNCDTPLNRSVQICPKGNKGNEQKRDINENEIQKDLQEPVQVILPIILPIIVPNTNVPSPSLRLTIQSSPIQQGQQQKQQQPLQKETQRQQQGLQSQLQQSQEQEYRQQSQDQQQRSQEIIKSALNIENNSDDEIQEVLRIVRKRSTSIEINHESPTRFEQEILVHDAIKDMKRMEDQRWHLLEKTLLEPAKKKRRSTKTNAKFSESNDECGKKRKRNIIESNSECNLVRDLIGDEYTSSVEEHVTKVQGYSGIVTVCTSDNVKENLMTCNNENINIPFEMLQRYDINYHNEMFEINNNTESIQEPVISRFLVPCSGGIENRSNGPAVIDLVNGTDE